MIEALSELDMVCSATPSAGGPEIPYFQVEIGKRKPAALHAPRHRDQPAAQHREIGERTARRAE